MNGEHNQDSAGPLVGSVIVVLVLLTGGYYSWKTSDIPPSVGDISANVVVSEPVPVISAPSKPPQESTEISDIEADAEAVDVSGLDSGLENLDLLVK